MPGKRPLQKVRLDAHALWSQINRLSMSQNELARLLGTSSGYLSQLINGQRYPSPRMRRRLLRVLGDIPFDELFTVEDDHGA